ncbi:septum site-determining protein MinC [Sphaerotilus microaerophilus]|uniref:Probable septum site-determining protein MinC n=1 Tax=Sphaerotilus microaerophilus TaxID=2914710 RepID=A0ABM7YTW3_9BURK|nr:septum site-determining protein MinC [Sphaerotilus sp. FB-5]BDI08126.1 putative septum site-determining protein MinC [Sphaerotilus sp. FB-5]
MSHPVTDLPAFDLKSSAWTLTVLRLHTADDEALGAALAACGADSPGLFDHEPVVVDLAALAADDLAVAFADLLATLRAQGLLPVAVQGGSPAQMAAALEVGLPEACARLPRSEPAAQARADEPAEASAEASIEPAGDAPPAPPAPSAPSVPSALSESTLAVLPAREGAEPHRMGGTLVVDTPLRSGQRVYARGADLVVLSAVSFGAEVIADGSIHVYGPLRGRAIAGASGDSSARIFSTGMDPQLVSIAGIYRTTEDPFPAGVQGQPAQVRLEGERIVIEPIRL